MSELPGWTRASARRVGKVNEWFPLGQWGWVPQVKQATVRGLEQRQLSSCQCASSRVLDPQ